MRSTLSFVAGLLFSASLTAQINFSDDFEAYSVGDYIGVESTLWTTWSGVTGGSLDVQVVDDNASNGANAIHLYSTGAGPQDVVLPFQGAYSTGAFHYQMNMFIEMDADAYFNFQANEIIGEVWSMECSIDPSGLMIMTNNQATLLTGSVPMGQWFTFEFNIDLNVNTWEVLIDDVSIGSFSNNFNQVASANFYPRIASASSSSFWLDEISYSHVPSTLSGRNAAVTAVRNTGVLAGQSKRPTVNVRNLGQDVITSFDVEIAYDGNTVTESVTGISLASEEVYEVDFSQALLTVVGQNVLSARVKNVNSLGADDDPADDQKSVMVDPVVPVPDKKVFVEEATGTWCGWCPRGTVAMANMEEDFPDFFVGVAVHNNDPMANEEYDEGLGDLISGYPSAVVDRGSDIDPSDIELFFLERIATPVHGVLSMESALLTDSTASIDVVVDLRQAISENWRVAVVLVEDDVFGVGAGWAQNNSYSGGANGELTGAGIPWHIAPGSVSGLKYDHVGRSIKPGFTGLENSFPAMTMAGDTFHFSFEVDLQSDWVVENMHAIAILIDENGDVDNAQKSEIGPIVVDPPAGIASTKEWSKLKVYPNPTYGSVIIETELEGSNHHFLVRDVTGRIMQRTNLNAVAGDYQFTINLSEMPAGIYFLELQSDGVTQTATLMKE